MRAFLDQELAPPNAAISGFLGMLLEDVRDAGSADLLPDLERMQKATGQLTFLIAQAHATTWGRPPTPLEQSQYEGHLRHDLRNPLNAIKGYSEILLEDMTGLDERTFVIDLQHVLACTHQMLQRIDRLADLGLGERHQPAARTDPLAGLADMLGRAEPAADPDGAPHRLVGRVLVVDDEPANRDLLSRRLAREGHHVAVAPDGARALAMTAEAEFDLILLDIMMPGISGFQVLRELKASETRRHIPSSSSRRSTRSTAS